MKQLGPKGNEYAVRWTVKMTSSQPEYGYDYWQFHTSLRHMDINADLKSIMDEVFTWGFYTWE